MLNYTSAMAPSTSFSTVAGYGNRKTSNPASVGQYRYALSIPSVVTAKIIEACMQTGSWPEKEGAPHFSAEIPMAHFSAQPRMEDTIIRWTQRICQQQSGFELVLNNFGALPPGLVYLRVQDASAVKNLAASLRAIDGYLTGNDQTSLEIQNRIYLPLFEKLNPQRYAVLSNWLARCEWCTKVPIQQLLLQRKNSGRWLTVQSFSLHQSL